MSWMVSPNHMTIYWKSKNSTGFTMPQWAPLIPTLHALLANLVNLWPTWLPLSCQQHKDVLLHPGSCPERTDAVLLPVAGWVTSPDSEGTAGRPRGCCKLLWEPLICSEARILVSICRLVFLAFSRFQTQMGRRGASDHFRTPTCFRTSEMRVHNVCLSLTKLSPLPSEILACVILSHPSHKDYTSGKQYYRLSNSGRLGKVLTNSSRGHHLSCIGSKKLKDEKKLMKDALGTCF